ncbi:basic 7S globulin-like [Tripterygium wilfordii]|uniref:basic 7S globulin-like n=1 Tax=Tripterygium wilfordii TaxID=458696 RepID=UPI0018F83F29|nr:basic 7S globulin-like [Tripterygium wilfordii]
MNNNNNDKHEAIFDNKFQNILPYITNIEHLCLIPSIHISLFSLCSIQNIMASSPHFLLILLSFYCLTFVTNSQAPTKPNNFVLPLNKDPTTNLHVANVTKRTPQVQVPLVIDLNGEFLWVNCDQNYLSSTYGAPLCHSTQCVKANSHYCHKCSSSTTRPGCHNNSCGLMLENPITHQVGVGELAQDVLSMQSIQGPNPGPVVRVPNFLFACAPPQLNKWLPKNVQGVLGLGHAPLSLPNQLASYFGFQPKFALCLPSSGNGVILFGQGDFYFRPGVDVSHQLTYTPLKVSREGDYHIQLSSIKINQKLVPLNVSLLSNFGTMISTTTPYTLLEHSIYQSFTNFFTSQLSGAHQVKAVAPFGVCYDSKTIPTARAGGPVVPNIDLVLANQSSVWRVIGANSMVEVRPGVLCLGFVDGGLKPRASIVLGAHQLEDNYLEFNLAQSRLGFSSSLLLSRTSCSNFKFSTSTP